jgi:hypothetical protein
MKPFDRYQWIEAWLRRGETELRWVDILDSDFVLAYAEATHAQLVHMQVGAPKCKQLARDLGAMFAVGKLERAAVGMPAGDSSMGFPKWVYSYGLATQGSMAALDQVACKTGAAT